MRRGWVALICLLVLGCGEAKSAPFAGSSPGEDSRNERAADDDEREPDDEAFDEPDERGPDDPDDEDPDAGAPDDQGSAGRTPPEVSTDDDWPEDEAEIPIPSGTPVELVRMLDPKGDAEPWPGMLRYPLDLLELEVEASEGELIVRFRFARTLAEHFAFPGVDGQRTAGAPVELHLDLDNDPSTGVAPPWASESEHAPDLMGYELELAVLLGYDFRDRDDGSEGYGGGDVILDDDEVEITGYYADYWFLDQTPGFSLGPSEPDAGFGTPDTRELTEIDGDTIVLHVPLEWLGVGSGDVVRLMYREQDQGPASGVGYSRNARLLVP